MKTTIICFIIALLLNTANAQIIVTPDSSITLTGYSSITAPTKESQKFKVEWARMKIEIRPKSLPGSITVEYDVLKSSLVQFNAQVSKKFGKLNLTGTAGRFFNPAWMNFSGPRSMESVRWPEMMNSYPVACDGVQLSLQYDQFVMRSALYQNGDRKEYAGSLDSKYGGIFFVQHVGYGAWTRISPLSSLTLEGGCQKSIGKKNPDGYAQIKFNPLPRIFFVVQGDFLSAMKPVFVGGMTYEYAPKSFLKLYYDTKTNGFEGRVTYSF